MSLACSRMWLVMVVSRRRGGWDCITVACIHLGYNRGSEGGMGCQKRVVRSPMAACVAAMRASPTAEVTAETEAVWAGERPKLTIWS